VKLKPLLTGFHNYSLPDQEKVFKAVERSLSNRPSDELWSQLRDVVAKHNRFADAAWALPPDQLKQWKDLASKFEPKDPISKARWLFDDYLLDRQDKDTDFAAQRRKVVADIYKNNGADGIIQLVSVVKLPHFVTEAISSLELNARELAELISLSVEVFGESQFTAGIGFLFHNRIGTQAAIRWLKENVLSSNGGLLVGVGVLLNWPNNLETWDAVRSLGDEVERTYWQKKHPYWMDETPDLLLECIKRFRAVKRPLAGLEAALNKLKNIPTDLLLTLLDEIRETLGDSDRAHSNISYEIERAFEELDKRDDASDLAIARLEVAYHPLFRFSDRPMRVHKIIAEKPGDYYELLANVFRAEDEEHPEEQPAEQVALAEASYAVLSNFKTIPGLYEKHLDVGKLTTWIDEVRRRAAEGKRAAVADQYIGHILAHSPIDDDGVWPLIAIREQIERLKSDQLQHGMQIEKFNMRGVYSKAVYEGGSEERQFAAQYRGYAEKAAAWPRTQLMLREIAKSWEADAEREDTSARQRKMRD